MAGIYIHIPFCHSKCYYCNFYSQTNLKTINSFTEALCKEIENEKDALDGEAISTLYFGGGTPSILNKNELDQIFESLNKHHIFIEPNEVTIEVNPDDVSLEKARLWKTYFNRISIGIQSFRDKDLLWMKRRHNNKQTLEAIQNIKAAGFTNISIDLIYGLPNMSKNEWMENIETAIGLNVTHISAYALTVEEGTLLYRHILSKKTPQIDEAASMEQFDILIEKLAEENFEQYEISNFSKPGFQAKHNSSYWKGIPYLGLGPSAHSYFGDRRRFNVANLNAYCKAISSNSSPYSEEKLTPIDQYNEYVMTAFRTSDGVSAEHITQVFGEKYRTHFLQEVTPFIAQQLIEQRTNYHLTKKGKHFTDGISAAAFVVDALPS